MTSKSSGRAANSGSRRKDSPASTLIDLDRHLDAALLVEAALGLLPDADLALVATSSGTGAPCVLAARGKGCEAWDGTQLDLSSPILDPVLHEGFDVVAPRIRVSAAGRSHVVHAVALPLRLSGHCAAALLVGREHGHWPAASLDLAALARLAVRADFALGMQQTR